MESEPSPAPATPAVRRRCDGITVTLRGPSSLQCKCKKCRKLKSREAARRVRAKNPDYHVVVRLRKLGVPDDQHPEIFKRLSGACEICSRENVPHARSTRSLFIDHDHRTGKFRGILCSRCNTLLGFTEDHPAIIEAVGRYLNAHAERQKRTSP